MFTFLGKTTLYGKVVKILYRKFTLRHLSTCCVQILWNFTDGKSVKSCIIYMTKKTKFRLAFQLLLLRRWCPNFFQGQPPPMCSECSRFHPNLFTFGAVIAKCVNTSKTCLKVNSIFSWNLALSRMIASLHEYCFRRSNCFFMLNLPGGNPESVSGYSDLTRCLW